MHLKHGWVAAILAAWSGGSAVGQIDDLFPESASVLRYRFNVGAQLVYERRTILTSLETGQEVGRITDQVQLWVLERVETEWLLLLDLIHIPNRRQQPLRGLVLYVDEYGRVRAPEDQFARLDDMEPVFDVLPALPLPIQSETEWAGAPDLFGRRWISHNAGPDGEFDDHLRVSWSREDPTCLSAALGATRFGRYWFDPRDGCVTRLEAEGRHRVANVTFRTAMTLRLRKQQDESWARKRAAEARQYLRCILLEHRTLDDHLSDPLRAEEHISAHERIWAAFTSDVEPGAGSPFEIIAHNERNIARDLRAHWLARADLARRWLNRPAGEWSLEKPDGRRLSSAALRTAVTIEVFWQSDGPSLRTLATARELQRQFLNRPVRVVCLNMDLDPALGRHAAQRCGDDLMHALAASLQATEKLPTLPAIRVIDAEGVTRGLWLGWRPDATPIKAVVNKLLE